MSRSVDVLVVGGGPAGSATAAHLARRGHRVLIVDRAVFPRPKPCGDYVNAGCDEVLERLGAREAVSRAGGPMRGMRVIMPDGVPVPLAFPHRNGWAAPRRALDHVLLDHAVRMGVDVLEGGRVVALDGEAGAVRIGVECRRRRGMYRARLLIGADGLRSTVAREAGLGRPARHGRYTVGAYLGGLKPADGDTRWGEIHLRADGYCGVAYLPGGLANVTLAVSRDAVRGWRGGLEAGYFAWLGACPGLRDRLAGVERVGPLTAVGPLGYHRRPAGRGRILLVGDAAAHVDPMTGQGIYLALRGAELCATAAASALERTGVPSIRRYAYARWREFGAVFALSRLLQGFAFRPSVVRRAGSRLARHPDVCSRLIGMIGNTESPAGVLHPAVFTRLFGVA